MKMDYEEQWKLASESDRNKASLFVRREGIPFEQGKRKYAYSL